MKPNTLAQRQSRQRKNEVDGALWPFLMALISHADECSSGREVLNGFFKDDQFASAMRLVGNRPPRDGRGDVLQAVVGLMERYRSGEVSAVEEEVESEATAAVAEEEVESEVEVLLTSEEASAVDEAVVVDEAASQEAIAVDEEAVQEAIAAASQEAAEEAIAAAAQEEERMSIANIMTDLMLVAGRKRGHDDSHDVIEATARKRERSSILDEQQKTTPIRGVQLPVHTLPPLYVQPVVPVMVYGLVPPPPPQRE